MSTIGFLGFTKAESLAGVIVFFAAIFLAAVATAVILAVVLLPA